MNNIIVTPSQMKELENASAKEGVSLYELMNNAGKALADNIFKIVKSNSINNSVMLLCGKGNNGGDGFVCANYLRAYGFSVTVVLCFGRLETDLASRTFEALYPGIDVISIENVSDLSSYEIIVDCIFGTGFHGEINDKWINELFKAINNSDKVKIACDIPSGCNSSLSTVSENTIKCDYTITFGAKKYGMCFYPCRMYCGEIITADIGIPYEAYNQVKHICREVDINILSDTIKRRSPDAHKGTYGKLLCICGSTSYTGAAMLSAKAALRSGVGICTLASVKTVIDRIASSMPECTYITLPENEKGSVDKGSAEIIENEVHKYCAVLIGCGLTHSEEVKKILDKVILTAECPIIIDADGINVLADSIDILRKAKTSVILTPHIGELARLCKASISEVSSDRLSFSQKITDDTNAIVVAKGAGTLITSKDECLLSITGNAGLSRGGSGDILAGIIASFAAQGNDCRMAAACGSYIHGLAADRIAKKYSQQGMLPSDIINELPLLFHDMNR